MNKDIIITLKDKTQIIWDKDEYDDYSYEGPIFVVKKDQEWVGIYNMDRVISVEVGLRRHF